MPSARSIPAVLFQTLRACQQHQQWQLQLMPYARAFSRCAGWQQWAAASAEGAGGGAGGAAACVDDAPSRALHEGASSRALCWAIAEYTFPLMLFDAADTPCCTAISVLCRAHALRRALRQAMSDGVVLIRCTRSSARSTPPSGSAQKTQI